MQRLRALDDPRVTSIGERSRWLARAEQSWLGLDRVYALALPERLDTLRRALAANGLDGRTSILRAFRADEIDAAAESELIERGVVATSPRPGTPHWLAQRVRPSQRPAHRRVERAIALGHLAILVDFLDSGAASALVLEDDIAAVDERDGVRAFLAEVAARDWDMLYLSYSHADARRSQRLADDVWRLHGQLCCNAYVLRRHAGEALLEASFPVHAPVDVLYRDVAEARDFVVLGPNERLFEQDRRQIASTALRRSPVMPPAFAPRLAERLRAGARAWLRGRPGTGYDEELARSARRRG